MSIRHMFTCASRYALMHSRNFTIALRTNTLNKISTCHCYNIRPVNSASYRCQTYSTLRTVKDEEVERIMGEALLLLKPRDGYNQISFDEKKLMNITRKLLEEKIPASNILQYFANTSECLDYSYMAWKTAVNTLMDCNFKPDQILPLLASYPILFTGDTHKLFQLFDIFRGMSFVDGQIQKILVDNPGVFYCEADQLHDVYSQMMLEFSKKLTMIILITYPTIFTDSWVNTLKKIEYGLNDMGLDHVRIAQTQYLALPLEEIKARHLYLVRAGLYLKPNPRGETKHPNPLAKEIFNCSDRKFCSSLGQVSLKDFLSFKKMILLEDELGGVLQNNSVNYGLESGFDSEENEK